MNVATAVTTDAEADILWQEWQARGVKDDQRTAAAMTKLTVLISIGLAVWLLVQLV